MILKTIFTVCPSQVLAQVEKHVSFKKCLLCMPSMSLSVSVCQNPHCRYWNQSRCISVSSSSSQSMPLISLLVIVGGLSGLLFTLIVMIASYITTFFISAFDEPSYYNPFYSNPLAVAQDLVTAAFRVMRDGDLADIIEDNIRRPSTTVRSSGAPIVPSTPRPRPGIIMRFIQRFIIGLPLVGAGSLVHLLLSVQILAPVQWLARYRGSRNRRNTGSRDIAALIVISLLVVGALRHVLY